MLSMVDTKLPTSLGQKKLDLGFALHRAVLYRYQDPPKWALLAFSGARKWDFERPNPKTETTFSCQHPLKMVA